MTAVDRKARDEMEALATAGTLGDGYDATLAAVQPLTTPDVMTPEHPRWDYFCDQLYTCLGLGGVVPSCCRVTVMIALDVLTAMRADVEGSRAFFQDRAEHGDCILFNIDPGSHQPASPPPSSSSSQPSSPPPSLDTPPAAPPRRRTPFRGIAPVS